MIAELVVVNGPRVGERIDLNDGDLIVGRDTRCGLTLSEPEISWRHCQIRRQGERYLVADLRSSAGTYINGIRSAERWLEDRDQIGIGKTILMFRSGTEPATEPAPSAENKPVLLAACSLVFLSRALASAGGELQTRIVQTQLLRLVADLIPVAESYIVLGARLEVLIAGYGVQAQAPDPALEDALARIAEEGTFSDESSGVIGVSIYHHGALGGALVLRLDQSRMDEIAIHFETLTAISSLVAVGFEAYQEVENLKAENERLQREFAVNTGIVGESPAVRKLLALIERVAPRDTTVLITGESGTGKELIARSLHASSLRRGRPFVAVNCAAMSEQLFESEMFGHEKGAFSGAIQMKRGRFEIADGGTIFLDEVGELALSLQAKLLRVLQEREFERVGGTQVHQLDIRLIAATNRDLEEDVRQGRFREDLFFRLNVVKLESPALRDRKDDISLLSAHFLRRSSERCKRNVSALSAAAEDVMRRYHWPGNVRELENAIERAVVLGVDDVVLPEDLPESLLEVTGRDGTGASYHTTVVDAKCEAILDAYAEGGGDYKAAARILGVHPNYLLRLVRNLNLRDEIRKRMDREKEK